MFIISVAMLVYKGYDWVNRTNERRALADAEIEIKYLEKELAVAKRNQYDAEERRRKFKRSY
jgi:hypothetical protein